MDLLAELAHLIRALDAAGIDYAVCGAIALAIHGVPRATQDIDLLAREADLDKLREVARSCGFVFESLPMTFSSSSLITLKLAAGRPQDIADLQRLKELDRG